MVTFENKQTNLTKVTEALENSLGIVTEDNRLSTIVNKISDSRYSFKLIDETETLPISSERATILYKNWLYVGGGEGLGNALVIIDTNTMQIIKQITLAMGINIVNTFNMVRDDTYWYIGTSESYVIRGNLETGDAILSKYNTSFRSVYCMCVDENYLYIGNQNSKFYKLTKDTLEIVTSTSWFYSTPISLICDGDFLIGGGSGAAAQNNSQSLVKINKADMSLVLTSNPTGGQVRECMIINGFLYVTTTDGRLTKWDKDTLTFISTIYTHTTIIRTLRYAFGDFWLGDDLGRTLRVSPTGQLLGMIQSENSSNYVLEINENNQMLYRNSSIDVTVTKYQIIDNLQNNVSDTVIKTANLVTLNTAGVWVDTVYMLNGMAMTCNTLSNGYLRQLSFTGTTTADSAFIFHTFDVNKKLLPFRNYILNGVKSTDSLTTTFIRLTLAENADGSGVVKVIEKVAGDFKCTTDGVSLFYKIEIIIKNGITLSSFLYNNIPMLQPTMVEYGKGEGPYLLKDLSEITLSSISAVFGSYLVDGKVFLIPTTAGGVGNIEVRDYQLETLLTTIATGATQTSTAITHDNTYIYISCIKGTPKSIYIQRYNRCTLAYVDEYLLYQNDTPTFNKMIYRDGYIYCQCLAASGSLQHSVKKWNTATLTTDVSVYFDTPLDLNLSTYGLVVGGRNSGNNADDLQKPVILNYSDLLTNKLFPKTSLSQQNWRASLILGNKLYIANDAGVICRYNIDTLALELEIVLNNGGIVRSIDKFKDVGILITNSFGHVYLYDFDLALIKTYDIFPTSTSGTHVTCLDNNNTFWYHSYQYNKIYKKQLIDLTKGVI